MVSSGKSCPDPSAFIVFPQSSLQVVCDSNIYGASTWIRNYINKIIMLHKFQITNNNNEWFLYLNPKITNVRRFLSTKWRIEMTNPDNWFL